MFDLSSIEADPKKLSEGVWHEIWIEPGMLVNSRVVAAPTDGACVLIVPYGVAWERARDEELRPYIQRQRDGKLDDGDYRNHRNAMGRALGRSVFRGCVNITANGAAITWSEQKAIELMTDERWKWFREFVERAAGDRRATALREEEQAAGN